MKLEFSNSPQPASFNPGLLLAQEPAFVSHEPNWPAMEAAAAQHKNAKNILVIGHGGSVTSFYGFYHALKDQATKAAYFLSTTDPDYIYELKQKLKPEDTVVVAISKSGTTTTQLEALMQFINYPLIFVTDESSALGAIAKKINATLVPHPPIGGRYTGFTEVGLLPAIMVGMDAKALWRGGQEILKKYSSDNDSWKAASVLWQLEQQGYVDVFMPFYSHNLFPFSSVIVQLCHESFGKEGRGQTYAAFEAPESQHHTNQRFFGGPKNMAGFFVSLQSFGHNIVTKVPPVLQNISMKDRTLDTLDGIPLQNSIRFEREGTMEDAAAHGIPLAYLEVESTAPAHVGQFLAFWQLYAVYASLLRTVDPFDQPQVETSKVISFNKRLNSVNLKES